MVAIAEERISKLQLLRRSVSSRMSRTKLSPRPPSAAAPRAPQAACTVVIDARCKEELHPEMQANIKAFEKELKCPICFEYVDDAVTPPCHHLFCRKCIVHAIERKSTCPVCSAAIQRGHRSLEPQPWTNEVINQYRLTLQEVFRDRETDFLFSQVPTGGFAAFKPPVPSPNRTKFMRADAPQPIIAPPHHHAAVCIPPPPVQARSLGGRKQLGMRGRVGKSHTAAASDVISPLPVAAASSTSSDTHQSLVSGPLSGHKREREGEMKQVTFALAESPRLQPASRTASVAIAPRAGLLAAAKSDANNSRTPVESGVSAPDTSLPLLASCNSIVPSSAPTASPFPSASASRTYGKTSRRSAAAPEQHVTSALTLNRVSSALHSPAKSSAADDHTLASNNTPGKDNTAAAAVDAAITPSTEPRVPRGKSSGRPPAVLLTSKRSRILQQL